MSPESTPERLGTWPDSIDTPLLIVVLVVMLGIPILGYVFMVIDFRRWLRSLRRALVVVQQYVWQPPYWSLLQRPTCLQALGLELPCTEEDVLASYRELAKTMHPDRGGDLQQFLRLQKHFEQAMKLVRGESVES